MLRIAHPEYLHLLWLLIPAVLLVLWSHFRWIKKRARLGDEIQRNRILPRYILRNSLIGSGLSLLALILWIIALSQPQYGMRLESAEKSASDVFLAFDVSRSMLAEDIKPNRLERAKVFAANLLQELGSERISIIPFAGHAYMSMPLTTDMKATRMILESLDENTASTQGTAISEAIKLATESAENLEPRRRIMIILTDGENHEKLAVDAAKDAANAQITIFPIGVGTEEGGRVPAPQASSTPYMMERDGSIAISRYNPELLRDIATATGGTSYNILNGNRVINDIKERIKQLDSQVLSEENFEVKNDYFGIFIISGILSILLALYIENFTKSAENA